MNVYLSTKKLKIIAILLWLAVGSSMLMRELTVFGFIEDIVKHVNQISIFFDSAKTRLNEGWENFDNEMAESDMKFQDEKKRFDKEFDKRYLKSFKNLGYEVSDGTIKAPKEESQPRKTKSWEATEDNWRKEIMACNAITNPDELVKCMKNRVKKLNKDQGE